MKEIHFRRSIFIELFWSIFDGYQGWTSKQKYSLDLKAQTSNIRSDGKITFFGHAKQNGDTILMGTHFLNHSFFNVAC